jgi:hypothetical protein
MIMTHYGPVDPKVIDQAIRNAHQIRSEEFHRVTVSLWRGIKSFFGALGEGVAAGRKANDTL